MRKIKYILIITIILGVILLALPNIRHYLLSGIVKIPSVVSTMRYQSHLEKRNFEGVVEILNDEYSLIKYFSWQQARGIYFL